LEAQIHTYDELSAALQCSTVVPYTVVRATS